MVEAVTDLDIEAEENEDDEPYFEYSLTSYPADFTLAVLFQQWKDKEILIPDYQRGYVWSMEQASKLIESFLIGLPIPQIFLYVDEDNKLIVIDGQQRITSIVYYFGGLFGGEQDGSRRVFRLAGLSHKSPYHNKSFDELDASTQRKLKGAPLRAINIKQLRPEGENSSVYEIFERLNTGGTPLKSQEIRNAVFRGDFNQLLKTLNLDANWRAILGKKGNDKHMRDVELLLRVFALTYFRDEYDGKMKTFLNVVMDKNKDVATGVVATFARDFPIVAENIITKLPPNPFRRGGPINSAMLEAIFCACLTNPEDTVTRPLAEGYKMLRADAGFNSAISQSTNSVDRVHTRFNLARRLLFSDV
jgi:hypothetical protein